MKSNYWLLFFVCVWFALCNRIQASDIALYSDRGAGEFCVTATANMFEWMGHSVELIDAGYINNQELDHFDLICFPGGNMYYYAQDIAISGKDKIRDFIDDGGGYVGICGGAYFTAERVIWQGRQLPMSPLALFQGTAQGPIDEIAPYPDCVMCAINVVKDEHPITESEPDEIWVMYCYGPMLLPDSGIDIQILGEYVMVEQPAVMAFEYGEGRVFVIGTHPETDEDSDRDGVDFGDEFDDKGSGWDFMQKATLWCLGESDD